MRWVTRKTAGFAILLIVVAIIPLLAFHLFREVAFEGFEAIGSVVTSLLLVALYLRQSSILQSQQEFQKRLERPVLYVEGFRSGETSDSMEFLITNSGRSAAQDVRLVVETGFSEQFSHDHFSQTESRVLSIFFSGSYT